MVRLSASLACADQLNLERDIGILETGGIDFFHVDVMDGRFVSNIAMGYDAIRAVKGATSVPVEVHLAVEDPEPHIGLAAAAGADVVTVHLETARHMFKALDDIHSLGRKACIAISPQTPVGALEYLLGRADAVNLLTVNPGFAGQRLIPETLGKLEALKAMVGSSGSRALLQVDGNTSFDNIPAMIGNGADVLVLGTSSLFRGGKDLGESLAAVKAFVEKVSRETRREGGP